MGNTERVLHPPRAPMSTPVEVDEDTPLPRLTPLRRDRALLVVLAGDQRGLVLRITRSELFIGRGDHVDARLIDPGLSWTHARVFCQGDDVYIEDLGSTNGTFVGNCRIDGPRRLRDGDHVGLGRNTVLRFALLDALEEDAALRLYESTVRDPLTGAFNRRYFEEHLRSEFSFAVRHGTPLSLLFFDIDHFKAVNDGWGHHVGDGVLQVITASVARMVRPEDVLARYGGEEFVVLIRGISANSAEAFAHRIREGIAQAFAGWTEIGASVTVSVGVATMLPERPYPTAEKLIKAADAAMYAAKARGRNCVVVT